VADAVVIKDEESARAWLERQDHQTRVWFATRCALRALPALGTWADSTTSGLAFASCQTILISVAAATCPPSEMKSLESALSSADAALAAADKLTVLSMDGPRKTSFFHPAAVTLAFSAAAAARSTNFLDLMAAADAAYNSANAIGADFTAAISSTTTAKVTYIPNAGTAAAWRAATTDANAPNTPAPLWHDDLPPESVLKT
jgi:hypothetical protein